ncbi:hypothetical protein K6I34_003532 [Streptomyces sp. UNOC14_S4]|nr:hypothetical protein [Streptomyces sp. UNOC14_S4]MCC3767011.1 hypothetical protein [Streptomyces sp. UNOC14_S4]
MASRLSGRLPVAWSRTFFALSARVAVSLSSGTITAMALPSAEAWAGATGRTAIGPNALTSAAIFALSASVRPVPRAWTTTPFETLLSAKRPARRATSVDSAPRGISMVVSFFSMSEIFPESGTTAGARGSALAWPEGSRDSGFTCRKARQEGSSGRPVRKVRQETSPGQELR